MRNELDVVLQQAEVNPSHLFSLYLGTEELRQQTPSSECQHSSRMAMQ